MLRSSYWKLKDKAIINITSSDITEFETTQYTGASGNPTNFRNNYRCKLNLPFQFSRNAKIVIDSFKFRGIIRSDTTDDFILEKLRVYTQSISVKNQFTTKNRGDFDIITTYFSTEDNTDTYIYYDGAAEAVTERNKKTLFYEYKTDDLEMNSLDLRSSDFTKNEIIISFDTRYKHDNAGNIETISSGIINGSEWNLRMIVYDFDEDTVNYASGEADVKININAVPNTGINKLLMPSVTL